MSQTGIVRKRKTHRGRVTEVNLAYEGSITIDRRLMEEVGANNVSNSTIPTTEAAIA